MTRIIRNISFATLLIFALSCAIKVERSSNESNMRFLEKWVEINYPGASQSELGTYILTTTPSTIADAKKVEAEGWVIVDFTSKTLDGTIQNTTIQEIAEKYLPSKSRKNYYYPQVFHTNVGSIMAGMNDVLIGMEVGESRTILIPSWLMSYKKYKNAQEYQNQTTEYGNTIYELKVIDYFEDIDDRDTTLILDYISKLKADYIFASEYTMSIADTVEAGFFYYPLEKGEQVQEEDKPEGEEGEEGEEEKADTTNIYINYTGTFLTYNSNRELITKTFDSSIENVAKDFGFYNAATKYSQKKITWGENFSATKMGESSVIAGFSKTLWQLKDKKDKKGLGIFWSKLGYGVSGIQDVIPAYSPLIFVVEVADKPAQ